MAQISWPTYTAYTATGTETRPIEWQSADLFRNYPGRRVIKAQFTNIEISHDQSAGEWTGNVLIAARTENSPEHTAVQTFIDEMQEDPGENWTLLPWNRPSIFSLNSVVISDTNAIDTDNNDAITSFSTISNGIGRISTFPTTVAGETLVITPGEHFGLDRRTYKVKTAVQRGALSAGNLSWDIQTVPELPDNPANTMIFKRQRLPVRIIAGQTIGDSSNGGIAGPWGFNVVEYRTD